MGWKNPFEFFDDIKDSAFEFIYSKGESAVEGIPEPVREELGVITKPVVVGTKVATRTVSAGLDFPIQALSNSLAFLYNNPELYAPLPVKNLRGPGFKKNESSYLDQLKGIVTNTTAGQAIADALPGGDKLNVGSGFFVEGQIPEDVAAGRAETFPTTYGFGFTVGRAFATPLADVGLIEPGDTAWNTISGGIDATYTLLADPVNLFPAGAVLGLGKLGDIPLVAGARAGKRAKVTTTLTNKSRKVLEKAVEEGRLVLDAAGGINNGRRTVNPNNWEAFKLTPKGKKFAESFSGPQSGTAAEIWRRSGGAIPPGTAVKLQKANTVDEVITIFDDAVYAADPMTHIRTMPGIDPRPVVTKTGVAIKGNVSRYRPFADTLPESTDFPLNNPLTAAKNADSVMGVLEVPLPLRNRLMTEMFQAFDQADDTVIFEWLNKFEDVVIKDQLKKWNYTDDEVSRIASWKRKFEATVSGYVTDSAGSSVPLPWLVGGTRGGYGPLLISQQLKVNPILIDPVDLRQIADRLGPVRSRLEKARRTIVEETIDPVTGEKIILETKPNKLVNTPVALVEAAGDLVDWSMSRVWKANILIRPKYLLKTLPEEEARLAASGIFDHHYQYIMQLFKNTNNVDAMGRVIRTARQASKMEAELAEANRLLRKFDNLKSAGTTTLYNLPIDDVITSQINKIASLENGLTVFDARIVDLLPGMDDAILRGQANKSYDLMQNPAAVSGAVSRGHVQSVERLVNPELWATAFAQRIAERASNGYIRKIAQDLIDGKSIDEITTRFHTGDLKPVLGEYIKNQARVDPKYIWDFDGVRAFVKKNIDDIQLYAMDDDSLLEAIAKNKFDGEELSGRRGFAAYTGDKNLDFKPNNLLKSYIKKMYSESDLAPARINYFPSVFDSANDTRNARTRISNRYDALLSFAWDGVYGAASDKLVRVPTWNQAKWQRIIELVPVMDKAEADKLVETVKKTNIIKSLKDDIIEAAADAQGEMTVEDVNLLGELFATRFTKDTYFDASRKTKFGASHRKIFPFFDAFVELTGSAAKLATNPKVIHRADQLMGELRQNTFFGTDIDGDGKKDSFLYKDPVSGEEMYAVSVGGGFLKEWRKNGLDFRVGNSLSGLSMVTTAYPGIGPVVAFPLIKMLPDSSDFDKIRDLIAPFGIPDLSSPDIAQFLIPGASDQVMRILGSSGLELFSKVKDRQKAAQSVIRALQVASATKDYDPATPGQQGPTGYDSIEQWQADGKELGTKIYGLIGWAGLFLPGAPIAQWTAKTRNGNVLIGVVAQRWNQIDKMGDKNGLDYQDKLELLVNEWGNENFVAFMQPITDRSIVGSSSTKEYYDWYRQNKTVVDKYQNVGGYFSPKSSELDPDVWNIQKLAGDVQYKDPKQFAINLESAIANFTFNRNMREVMNSISPDDMFGTLANLKIKEQKKIQIKAIQAAYPNWDRAAAATASQRNRRVQLIEARKFIAEPSVQDNDAVKAATEYFKYRDANVAYTVGNFPQVTEDNWSSASKIRGAVVLRQALWDEGERLAEKYPQFVNLWQNVLSREFISVEVED